MGLINYRLNKA